MNRRGLSGLPLSIECAIALTLLYAVYAVFGPTMCRMSPGMSRRITCAYNLRQIGSALLQYTQDYDETFPRTVNRNVVKGNLITWRQAVSPYIGDTQTWKCPMNNASGTLTPLDGLPQSYDAPDTGPIRRGLPVPMSTVKALTRAIVVFEEDGINAQALQIGVPWKNDDGNANWTNIVFANHLATGNFLFADGHVKSLQPLQTIQTDNMWNIDNYAPVSVQARKKLQVAQNRANKGSF